MLLTIEQANKLKYIANDESGNAAFVYRDKGKATREDLKYAIDMHDTYTAVFDKPFIGNINELRKRINE